MRNINYKLLLCCSTLLLLPQLVQAQSVESCKPTDCAALGYTRNNTDYCATYARCPFDASYKFCTHVCDDSYITVAKKIIPLVIDSSSNSLTEAEVMANMDASLTKDLGFNNTGLTKLRTAVQKEFGVTISDSDAANIKTVNDIISYLGETCDAYPLSACPSGATCDSQYDITSCQSGYKLSTAYDGSYMCKKQLTIVTCPAGQYNDSGTCTDCPAGSYNATAGKATSCTLCPVGTYQDETGQTKCKECSSATGTGTIKCLKPNYCKTFTSCPDGAICSLSNGVYTITECQSNYSAEIDTTTEGNLSSTCITNCVLYGITCPAGKYVDRGSCTDCPAGQYKANENTATSCNKCAPGSYQPSKGQSACILCAPGTYQNLAGQTSCKNCIYSSANTAGAKLCKDLGTPTL